MSDTPKPIVCRLCGKEPHERGDWNVHLILCSTRDCAMSLIGWLPPFLWQAINSPSPDERRMADSLSQCQASLKEWREMARTVYRAATDDTVSADWRKVHADMKNLESTAKVEET